MRDSQLAMRLAGDSNIFNECTRMFRTGGCPKSSAMRVAEFAVRSYLAVLAAGYVVLCSALLSLVIR
jgi:hypothetical protein